MAKVIWPAACKIHQNSQRIHHQSNGNSNSDDDSNGEDNRQRTQGRQQTQLGTKTTDNKHIRNRQQTTNNQNNNDNNKQVIVFVSILFLLARMSCSCPFCNCMHISQIRSSLTCVHRSNSGVKKFHDNSSRTITRKHVRCAELFWYVVMQCLPSTAGAPGPKRTCTRDRQCRI